MSDNLHVVVRRVSGPAPGVPRLKAALAVLEDEIAALHRLEGALVDVPWVPTAAVLASRVATIRVNIRTARMYLQAECETDRTP